uniref:Translocon-associated protein subunit alpha n=1 Tax=Kalanchoe fedtschenkoi TaxID=63787 RepID=A0A7N0U5U9_KALFE
MTAFVSVDGFGKCQSDVDSAESVDEGGDIGIVGEDVQDFGEEAFSTTAGTFNQSTVPPSATATYPYLVAVSPFLRSGNFDLVATVIYEIDQSPYQTTFYNGTIEVVEAGGVVSIESIFLITLGVALLVFLGIWVRGQVQNLSKKSKKAPFSKVEVAITTRDASLDEWRQGTAYSQSLASKSKKQQ